MVNSFDSWTRLREVILGDVYPIEWYEHLPSEIRDTFQLITEWTKEDLNKIERKLVDDFGIVVQRPKYIRIEDHLEYDNPGVLRKPEITPRDIFLTLGNTFWLPHWAEHASAWQHVYERYRPHLRTHDFKLMFCGANIVKAGKDFFLDCAPRNNCTDDIEKYFYQTVAPCFPGFRPHYLSNGGHIDGCFAILKPGHLLVNHYFDDYDRTFPGWDRLMLSQPEFFDHDKHQKKQNGFDCNLRWYLPGNPPVDKSFHEHVIKYAQDWIGNYTETFFEVNCLVIDEKNVMVLGRNEAVFRYLEKIGITAHAMDFRCRTFWDGGLHCLTVDVRRDGGMATYL